MNTYWGTGGTTPRILNLGTRWRWSVSCLSRFTLGVRAPGTHRIAGWVDPEGNLITSPAKNRTPVVQPATCELVKYIPKLYSLFEVTRRFSAVLTKARHWNPSLASYIKPPFPIKGTRNFIAVFTKHNTGLNIEPVKANLHLHTNSLRSVSVSSSHLRLFLPCYHVPNVSSILTQETEFGVQRRLITFMHDQPPYLSASKSCVALIFQL